MVDARDLKSLSRREYGFESHRPHQHLVGIVCHDALPLAPLATSLKISLYKRSPSVGTARGHLSQRTRARRGTTEKILSQKH